MSTTGYVSVPIILGQQSQTLGASSSQVVTSTFRIMAEDSLNFLAIFHVSAVVGSVDITLEHSDDGTSWDAVAKTGSISGTGRTSYSLMAADVASDRASLPLRGMARFKLTTGGGESITVDAINVMRRA